MLSAVLSLLLAGAASRADVCPADLPLQEALQLAGDRSPEARGLTRAVDVRRALDDEIPLFVGNPQLLVSSGPRAVPSSDFGVEGALGVYAPLDVGGRGFAERESASASRAALLAERDQALLDARVAAADAWFSLWESQRALDLARAELAVAKEVAAAIARAAESEAVSSADAARARRYLAEVRLEVAQREGQAFERALELATSIGCSGLDTRLDDAPLPAATATAASGVDLAARYPAVRARGHAARAAREQGEALLRGAWDGVSVGVVAEKDGPKNYRALLELQLPLPLLDRAQAERAAVAAAAARLEGEREALQRAARAELERAAHEVEHSGEVLEVAREALVPATDDAERLERVAFALGASTLIERLRAREDRLRAARALLAAEAGHARARWRLALLTQALEGAAPSFGAPSP